MVIDIIPYTDAQYALLSSEQLLEIQSAQRKKDRLTAALEEDLQKEKHKLLENGTYLSCVWPLIYKKLQDTYEAEVEKIRQELLFYLRFSGQLEAVDAPYTVDYTLSVEDRMYIVKDYYMETYSDGVERFEAFKADEVAKQYLCELYAPLYDYFRSFTL